MIKISHNKDISGLNTFGMKVRAACYVEYSEAADLPAIDWNTLPRPIIPIGSGSNLLFEEDFGGTLLHCTDNEIKILEEMSYRDEVFVEAGAGVVFDDLCHWAALQGLWGIENLSGIPGTVGASAVQNVGAYGVEAGDVIEQVICFELESGHFVSMGKDECQFAYRDSFFKHNRGRFIVASVIFHLTSVMSPQLGYGKLQEAVEHNLEFVNAANDPYMSVINPGYGLPPALLTPMLVRDTVRIIREEKLPDPKKVGSAGSFFKNPVVESSVYDKVVEIAKSVRGEEAKVPHYDIEGGMVKIPAAWLIDFCGFKGKRIGGAGVWESQPLVIVNANAKATPSEILALEKEIIDTISMRFGIELHPEVDHIAKDGIRGL